MSFLAGVLTAMILPYLIGSVSSAVVICKLMRLPDPRTVGSKNPGATNVLRTGSKTAAAMTLIGDLLKGFIPVKIALLLGANDILVAITAFAAIVGHIFPVYYQFKGGKGVATSFGAILSLHLPLAIIIAGIWLLTFLIFKYSSLAAITAISLSLVYAWSELPNPQYIMLTLVALLLLWRHRENLVRLLKGTEPKFIKK